MTDHTKIAAALEDRLGALKARSGAIEGELRQPLDADSSEQAVDLADDEALAGTDAVIQQEIRQIEAALARIADGTYGVCSACGGEIAPARLEALPAATRCIACA